MEGNFIKIPRLVRPYSHLPGTRCLIPTTPYVATVYPARLEVRTLEGTLLKEFSFEIQGPLAHFTVMQDLERGCLTIFGSSLSYHLLPSLELVRTKHPHTPPLSCERFHFGLHKQLEWERVKARGDFREIFPLWMHLASLLPPLPPRSSSNGIFHLLTQCREAVKSSSPEKTLPLFKSCFLAGFGGLLVPRLQDEEFQGLLDPHEPPPDETPLHLLQEGAALIRSLFIQTTDEGISLLPHLPPLFCSGKALHLHCPPWGTCAMEWSKKSLRRLLLRATHSGLCHLTLPPEIRSFRIRQNLQDRGLSHSAGIPLEIKSGALYLLDHFQK